MNTQPNTAPLGTLRPGAQGTILSLASTETTLTQRLLEMGLIEGSAIEVLHEAPFGGDPIAVRVRGTLIALRRHEANLIEVALS